MKDKRVESKLTVHASCNIGENTSVIRRKANPKKGVSRKQSTPNFPKNEHLLPPETHTYVCVSGGKNVRFSKNLACFVILKNLF